MYRFKLLVLLCAVVAPLVSHAADFAYRPGDAFKGRSMAELSNAWWQWAMSMPDEASPVRDRSGRNCGVGQQGDIWFLAGGFGSSKIRRVCTVPAGKTLFFPLINMAYWSEPDGRQYSCEQVKAAAALNNATALDLFAEIDGVPVDGLNRYRIASDRCFDMFARIPEAQRPYKAYPAASDGFWLMLKPLPKGTHTLRFGGRYNRNSPAFGRMVQDIEYALIVQ